jgi:transposase InsO family protein
MFLLMWLSACSACVPGAAYARSKHHLPIAPNRFNQQLTVSSINRVWLTDFTYTPTSEGFSYRCAFKDLCSRRIVGWAMSRKIDTQLALAALNQAVALRQPGVGLIIHSDVAHSSPAKRFAGDDEIVNSYSA